MKTYGVGVIGCGYWGPNLVRNFARNPRTQVLGVCDSRLERAVKVGAEYRIPTVTDEVSELIAAPGVDLVVVATPSFTHFELARAALDAGKHVLVMKPLTTTSEHAEELCQLAERKGRLLAVDHTFVFTGAVRHMRALIDAGEVGDLYYFDSVRINLGLIQTDVNVVWDLAPHDLSIMDYVIQEKPEVVVATGEKHLNGVEDVAFITVYFPKRIIAHINVNWLSPVKVRTTLIGGEKKMLVWNDLDADEKIKVYDKGVDIDNRQSVRELLVSYRSGDMWSPKVEQIEALRAETKYFVDCISNNERPFNDGVAGLRVVRMLEAADKSLKDRGKPIRV